ncbi:MAG: hypothetical protein OSB62_07260 [Alphaproteobacteria bacterium]|nr:hypothetical protein [Alphaproteobacteria bacterium]
MYLLVTRIGLISTIRAVAGGVVTGNAYLETIFKARESGLFYVCK